MDKIEELWSECLTDLNLESGTLLHKSTSDPFRRVYILDGHVYKVVALRHEISSDLRAQNLAGEHEILKHCTGIPGIPSAISFHQTDECEVLVTEYLPGESLANLRINLLQQLIVQIKLGILLLKLSWRGISHNDIVPENVLVASTGSVSLIDFDQATRTRFFMALIRQFIGIGIGNGKVHGSLITIFKRYIKKKLSPRTVQLLRKLRRSNKNEGASSLPILPDDASFKLKMLLKAWRLAQLSDASSPGRQLAYYSLDVEGYHYPGERPWINRWKILQSITVYSGKRILEIGCNMALLSCFLLKESHANAALAVDVDPKIIEAAKNISLAFGVNPILRIQDLDAPNDWESELADFKPDIVFALNVLNWVQDKKRFLNFLGRFREIIYEGHDSFDVESKRLRAVGFKRIKIIHVSERKREVIHCHK